MRAVTYARYGGPEVLETTDEPIPEPGPGELRIAVRASSVNPYEFHFVRGEPLFMRLIIGFRKPKVRRLGRDVSGVVDAVGPDVEGFAVGDEVFGAARGAYAEFAVAEAGQVGHKPDAWSFEEAAAVGMCAITAWDGFTAMGGVRPGQRILVNGASGGIGHLAVQIAKAQGAIVVATCKTENVGWVRDLGADEVIDYTHDSFLHHGPYDGILDTVHNEPSASVRDVLVSGGGAAIVGWATMGNVLGPLPQIGWLQVMPKRGRTLTEVNSAYTTEKLEAIAALGAAGALRPVIEQILPLDEVGAGVAHVEAGHSKGKTVIRVSA